MTIARERKPGRPDKPERLFDRRYRQLAARRGAEAGARLYLEELRWPGGVTCPRCASGDLLWLEARSKHHCRHCKYQFRVTAGTVLHDSHVSLAKWLEAVALVIGSEQGYPATRLRDTLGLTYKTAWFVGHRIRAAMAHPLHAGAVVGYAPEASPSPGPRSPGALPDPSHPAAEKWALARTLIAGAYHRPSIKHLGAYWNEVQWRTTHAASPEAFREIVVALLATEPLPYDELVEAPPGH